MLRLIALVAEAGHGHGKKVAVCGALGSDVDALPILIGLGVHEISATPVDDSEVEAHRAAARCRDAASCRERSSQPRRSRYASARAGASRARAAAGTVTRLAMKRMLESTQALGRALMLPIAVLPVAGLLLRLGQPDLLNIALDRRGGRRDLLQPRPDLRDRRRGRAWRARTTAPRGSPARSASS